MIPCGPSGCRSNQRRFAIDRMASGVSVLAWRRARSRSLLLPRSLPLMHIPRQPSSLEQEREFHPQRHPARFAAFQVSNEANRVAGSASASGIKASLYILGRAIEFMRLVRKFDNMNLLLRFKLRKMLLQREIVCGFTQICRWPLSYVPVFGIG